MSEPWRVDVVYADGHWLTQVEQDSDGEFNCLTLMQFIKVVERALPMQSLLFIVDRLRIEYHYDAETQFIEPRAKSRASDFVSAGVLRHNLF